MQLQVFTQSLGLLGVCLSSKKTCLVQGRLRPGMAYVAANSKVLSARCNVRSSTSDVLTMIVSNASTCWSLSTHEDNLDSVWSG